MALFKTTKHLFTLARYTPWYSYNYTLIMIGINKKLSSIALKNPKIKIQFAKAIKYYSRNIEIKFQNIISAKVSLSSGHCYPHNIKKLHMKGIIFQLMQKINFRRNIQE